MIPKTAGKILTESEIRAYMKCSTFYHFGGKFEGGIEILLLKYAFEKVTTDLIKAKKDLDIAMLSTQYLIEAIKLYEVREMFFASKVNQMLGRLTILFRTVFLLFPMKRYIPISGPIPYRVKVSKTPIELKISALFQSRSNSVLHVVDFSPYETIHSMANDPIVHMKIATLKNFLKSYSKELGITHGVKLHSFNIFEKKLRCSSLESKNIDPRWITRITGAIRLIEQGHSYPIVPCPHKCKFKRICKPLKEGTQNEQRFWN